MSHLHSMLLGMHYSVAWTQGTLTPPDTWSRPIWDLHTFYLLRPIHFPKVSLFFRTMLVEHSRFSFVYVLHLNNTFYSPGAPVKNTRVSSTEISSMMLSQPIASEHVVVSNQSFSLFSRLTKYFELLIWRSDWTGTYSD